MLTVEVTMKETPTKQSSGWGFEDGLVRSSRTRRERVGGHEDTVQRPERQTGRTSLKVQDLDRRT